MLRRSLIRYMNLALILVLRSISSAVKQRFPTLEHVVEAGKWRGDYLCRLTSLYLSAPHTFPFSLLTYRFDDNGAPLPPLT